MDDILKDESNQLEYKEELPTDSKKWLKTIVSFSNTAGGSILIGVKDDTKEIVGIEESRTSLETKIMDTIFNGVEPTPIINTRIKNYEGKDVFIIDVAKGNKTPYYLKNEDDFAGTYVRFGSTDRQATESQLTELKLNNQRISYSEILYQDNGKYCELNDQEVSKFLTMINEKTVLKPISKNKLVEWALIKKEFDSIYATNGYMLLNTNPFTHAYIKLGIFTKETKTHMFDEVVFEGSVIDQFNDVVEYLTTELYEGFEFKKIREKKFQIPKTVIREIMANAIIHRNYADKHPIRVEIYSNRLEVFSPGTLYDGLQLEDIMSGVSKLRNSNIAELFYNFGYIEKWGSGIQRSNEILREHKMKELEIETNNIHGITVTIYFDSIENNVSQNVEQLTVEEVLKHYKSQGINFKRKDIEIDFQVNTYIARSLLEEMLMKNLVEKVGKGPATSYKIK